MEMHERIKDLRKKHLALSQEAFGRCLGVSRSVINNIERNALARPEQKLSLIKLMCRMWNFSEDYILYGTGSEYTDSDTFSLDEFAKQRDATDFELGIMKKYFELEPEVRKMLIDHFVGEQPAAVQKRFLTREEIENIEIDVDELERLANESEEGKRVV